MERRNTNEVMIGGGGGRQSDLRKSFRLAVRPLLTCCSYEDFTKGFSRFNSSEQQSLRHLFIQVITSLHKMIEEEFESLCIETQVGTALDTVEQLVEEQSLDPLFSDRTNVLDVARDLSMEKEKEIHHLMGILERVGVESCSVKE
uniref:Uncharacterized protein n=1 Tax=Rhizophora mucronata TaxID=61149 RepID=A0A2P2K8A9_RHIMU